MHTLYYNITVVFTALPLVLALSQLEPVFFLIFLLLVVSHPRLQLLQVPTTSPLFPSSLPSLPSSNNISTILYLRLQNHTHLRFLGVKPSLIPWPRSIRYGQATGTLPLVKHVVITDVTQGALLSIIDRRILGYVCGPYKRNYSSTALEISISQISLIK